jgi:Fur family ferric uptake transcriptional regulator
MASGAIVAKESHLGRSKSGNITRPSLMKELAARGVRMTSQRRLLVNIIQDSPRHLDAAKLLQLAQKKDAEIDRATVYRTLGLLKRHGLIDELDLMHIEGEKHYYEAKTNRDHCHMACFRCGAIMEYASSAFDKLKEEIARESGFQIRVVRLEIGGFCGRCKKFDKRRFLMDFSCDSVATSMIPCRVFTTPALENT